MVYLMAELKASLTVEKKVAMLVCKMVDTKAMHKVDWLV